MKINIEEAKIVKFIYDSYISGIGIQSISNKLFNMGVKPRRSNVWGKSSITHILTNPVYLGKVKYTDKATKKKSVNGKVVRVKNNEPDIIYVDGLHDSIIDIDTWNKVQSIRKNNLSNRTKVDYSLKNPLSSILRCGICGKAMKRITYSSRNDIRLCCKNCKENIGSNFNYVEEKLLEALTLLLSDYKLKLINNDNSDIDLLLNINLENQNKLNDELQKSNLQLNNIYDLLEQGVYTKETFIERLNLSKAKIEALNNQLNILKKEATEIMQKKNNKQILIPKIEKVIEQYYKTNDINLKNKLLKSVLQRVDYIKVNPKTKDDFKLKLFPKLY